MIVGVRQLVDAARAAYIIINTTGFVTGPGRMLKGYKIEATRPDVIVALEHGRELRTLLQAYRHYRILRLPASAYATPKTYEQRRAARQRAFGRYFATAATVELALRQVIFQRASCSRGGLSTRIFCTPSTQPRAYWLSRRRHRRTGPVCVCCPSD
jgi:polynucleotide 5'-hydroxyl-kinase GRC3/NOL9